MRRGSARGVVSWRGVARTYMGEDPPTNAACDITQVSHYHNSLAHEQNQTEQT
jgi:hypothetical protein